MSKVICPMCGGGSFRYLRKENMSYCLRCGYKMNITDYFLPNKNE